MLAGYTYGPSIAFLISYFSSLIGAVIVFLLFRHLVPTSVASSLLPPSLKRVVRAIEQRPSIFLLIRIAPYPYNVLNAVLGSSSRMSIWQYGGTTALSLLKVIVHTTLGSEIRSFAELHAEPDPEEPEDLTAGEINWKEVWTIMGIVLCVGLFIYLAIVAHRAVDEECVDEEGELEGGVRSGDVTGTGIRVTGGAEVAEVEDGIAQVRGTSVGMRVGGVLGNLGRGRRSHEGYTALSTVQDSAESPGEEELKEVANPAPITVSASPNPFHPRTVETPSS